MKGLHISPSLSLPIDFVTFTQAILAKKGSGKSYTASVEAEELLELGQQVVVIDPTGAWHGLRSSADGKEAGYAIAVFGGEHGDVPLEPTAGEVIAEAIASEHFSAVLDLSLLRKSESNRFMAIFLETLYRKNRQALHLFIDEADTVAPQKPFGDEARTLGATEDIVRRGRIRGIGCTLITQRPQVLNKNVLSQVDMLTALRMNHPKDIGAIKEWVAVHADEAQAKRMISDLPALPIGEAWLWAPATDLFERVKIRKRRTFDSGRTPKAGEHAVTPKVLAKVDLARLGSAIASTVEQVKANDPKALKARVVELEKQLAAKVKPAPAAKVEIKTVEKPIVTDKAAKSLADSVTRIERRIVPLGDELKEVAGELAAVKAALHAAPWKTPSVLTPITRPQVVAALKAGGEERRQAERPAAMVRRDPKPETGVLPVGEAATLRALIQYTAGLERRQLTVITGYKRSTRDAYIARLREKGLVDVAGDRVLVTREGMAAMPDAEPLPTGAALQDYWLQRLPSGEGTILAKLLEVNGDDFGRDDLSEATGFKRSTRDAYLSRLAAKELVVDLGRGFVKASPTLFEVAT